MTAAEALRAIAARVETGWSTTRVAFDGNRQDVIDAPWIRVTVIDLANLSTTHGATGARLKQRQATLVAQVFAPLDRVHGDSSLPALTIAEQFAALFDGVDVTASTGETINFRDAETRRIGVDAATGAYQVNVIVRHTYPATF